MTVPCHPEHPGTRGHHQHQSDPRHPQAPHGDLTPTRSGRASSEGRFLLDFTRTGTSPPWAPPCRRPQGDTYELQALVAGDGEILHHVGGAVGTGHQHVLHAGRLDGRGCGEAQSVPACPHRAQQRCLHPRDGQRVAGPTQVPFFLPQIPSGIGTDPFHWNLLRKKVSLGSALSMSAPCSSCWASQRWLPLWLAKVCGMCSTWFIFRDDSSAGQGRG